jgi:opine dehydrogenase
MEKQVKRLAPCFDIGRRLMYLIISSGDHRCRTQAALFPDVKNTMDKTDKIEIAVLGAGHGGLAMAGHLALMDFSVRIYNRTEERIWGVISTGGVEMVGDEVEGFGAVSLATTSIQDALRGVRLIMVVVPATGHRDIAEICAPHLQDGQIVVLNPGRTFGALEFKQVLAGAGCKADVIIAETQTFIYASRAIGPGQARIFGIKNSIPVASVRAHLIPEVLKLLRLPYPQFVPGDNIFKTSFNNIGSVFHPAVCVLNAGWIEDVSDFQFYHEGISPSVAKVLEEIDAERIAVAETLGIQAMSARHWLYRAYNAAGENLFQAIRANVGYKGINAPSHLKMRYLNEDIPMSLVPMASLGRKFGVETPAIDAIIRLASLLNGCDYWAEGRTVERLGIADLDLKELRLLAIGEERQTG